MDALIIASEKDISLWLSDKPRAWSVLIALRCGLRVLPVQGKVARRLDVSSRLKISSADLALATFRSILVSSTSIVDLADDILTAAAAAARSGTRCAALAATDIGARSAAFAASASAFAARSAARSSARSAALAAASAATSAADSAARASARSPARSAALIWQAVSSDAQVLTSQASNDPVAALLQAPLWPEADIPTWAREFLTEMRVDDTLRAKGFGPWFDWYEGLLPLTGTATTDRFGPDLTRRIALQPTEWWDRGAKAVNADIAAWLAERDKTADAMPDVPSQVPAAVQFKPVGGRIGAGPPPPPEDPAAAQAFLDDLRERADDAVRRLDSAGNAVPFLVKEVTRLRDDLPATVEGLNPYRLRGRLVTIDAAVATLQSAGPARELSDDATMQVTALSFAGRELLLCYPDLRSRERESIARAIPYGEERSIAEALAVDAKAAAEAPAVVTEEAAAALEAISAMASEAAEGPVEAQRDRVVELVVVNRNFRSEVVRFGWDLWDQVRPGMLDGAGSVSKHALVFGFAGLVGALTTPAFGPAAPVVGIAALFAGYGQIDRALNLLYERFTKKAKETKDKKEET